MYFHLLITDLCKTSIMYHGCVTVCMAGPTPWSKLLAKCHITYVYDTHAVLDNVLLLHNTKFGMPLRLTVQCELNKNHLRVSN